MFTWIQRYFQRHFGIIFALILVAMAIPMVVIFAPSSGIGQGDKKIATREVFGYNLGSQEDQARLFGDANLSAMLQLGYTGLNEGQLQQYAFQRAAALHLAKELHIPTSSKPEITDFIKGLRAFTTQEGQFDAIRYNAFRDSLKAGGRYTESDVSRILEADVRADKVRKLLAGPGYVLDADIVAQLKRIETQWTLGLVTVNYENFKPSITPTNEQLSAYYSDNGFRYVISPRVSVNYVLFPAADFTNQVSVTEDELKALFEAAPDRYKKPAADGKGDPVPAISADFALFRDQVEVNLKLAKARKLATKAASDLSLAFYESNLSNDAEAIASLLSAHQLKEQSLIPFTANEGPVEFNHSADVTEAAFRLGADRFYSDAVPVTQGAVILLWKETLPDRQPLLNEVLTKVTADYVENEKRKQFVALGMKIKALLQTQLKSGADLITAVKNVAETVESTIDAKLLAPFSATKPPPENEFANFNVVEDLEKGVVSDMIITADKGLLVYAADMQLPILTNSNPKFAETRQQIAAITSRMGASKILEELVAQELKKSEPKLN